MPKISKVVDLTKVNRRHSEIVFRTNKCDALHLEIYTGITAEPDATAELYVKKSNGKIVSQACTMNDTIATIDVLNGATDTPGTAEGIVKITDSEGEYCTPTFRFAILDSFAHEDSIGMGGIGITAEQAAQIQANKTAIQTINKTIGNKNELPVGDANIIASINRIDSKTSTGGTGLTAEQEERLNKIPMIEQSVEEITNNLNNKANISDIPTAIEAYVTTHRDELKGDTGAAGRDGINAVNPNFTIGTVIELEKGNPPTVTMSGTYPNLVLNFGIPTKEPAVVEYMYYGRLPIADVGGRVIPFNQITEAMILKGVTDGKLTKSTPHTLKKESLGRYSQTAVGDYQIVVVPTSKNYTVTKDNGLGGKVPFDEDTSGANGIDITVNTVSCKLYGEILTAQGEKFIYVD